MGQVALITGVNGQDGSYLSSFLLDKGYDVHGVLRRASVFTTERIEALRSHPRFHLHYGDMADSSNLHHLVSSIMPDEVYNLAAQSHVAVSFEVPEYTADADALGTLRLLEAIRDSKKDIRFYQASTSELFGGDPVTVPQSELTPFHPKSPYGAAKLYAYWTTVNYREAYGMFAVNGILFNHESPRRGETFVTKKITNGVARQLVDPSAPPLHLGNLDAKRDWGYAPEYVEAMWLMLQQSSPQEYVIATGQAHTVKQFVDTTYTLAGIPLVWDDVLGNAYHARTERQLVVVDSSYLRPNEVPFLLGNPNKAKKYLGWSAQTRLEELCQIMLSHDIAAQRRLK